MQKTLRQFVLGLMLVGLLGCEAMVLPPADDGGDTNGGDMNGEDMNGEDGGAGEETTELTTITFEGATGFPSSSTDVNFEVDGRSVRFTGGFALRRGIPALYGEGSRAWMINSSMDPGRIDLSGLNVVGIRFFWAQLADDAPALLTWTDNNGTVSEPIASVAVPGNDAMLEIEAPEGMTIEQLDLSFNDDAEDNIEASLDTVTLIVANGG